MDKNTINVSYYDTEKQAGGRFQFCPEVGNEVIRNIVEANRKGETSIGVIFPNNASKEVFLDQFVKPHSLHQNLPENVHKTFLDVLYPHRHFLNIDVVAKQTKTIKVPEGYKPYVPQFTNLVDLELPSISELYSQQMLAEKIKHSETEALKKLPKPLVIMFNAPPRAGKDTACEILMRKFPESVKYEYFKEYLYKESAKILGLDFNFWASVCQDGALKDKPMLKLESKETTGSLSPRDILINVAENVLKPKYGKNCIAIATANKIAKTIQEFTEEKGYNPIIVVPDLGFPYEADVVRELVPSAEVVVVHITREGYTFEGDSRNYVPNAKYKIENTTLKSFEEVVLSIFSTEVQEIMMKHCWLK